MLAPQSSRERLGSVHLGCHSGDSSGLCRLGFVTTDDSRDILHPGFRDTRSPSLLRRFRPLGRSLNFGPITTLPGYGLGWTGLSPVRPVTLVVLGPLPLHWVSVLHTSPTSPGPSSPVRPTSSPFPDGRTDTEVEVGFGPCLGTPVLSRPAKSLEWDPRPPTLLNRLVYR